MIDNTQSGVNDWFELTDNAANWENQIKKLREELADMFDGRLDFDPVKKFKVEEEVFNKI